MASSSTEPADMMAAKKRNDIAIDIEAMLDLSIEAQAPVMRQYSIYKVPDQIRKLNKDAYTPKVVSIGPFHHGRENIREMEIYKKIYFKRFLVRNNINLDDLVSRVEELEPRVRGCYSENIECSKEEFVKIILVDAGFIIELVYLLGYGEPTGDDALLGKRWLIDDMMEDLYLLENQLPLFFLEELYQMARITPSFHDLTSAALFHHARSVENLTSTLHFTDLLRESCLQNSVQRQNPRHDGIRTVCSATKLHELGVKFKADRTSKNPIDLGFSFSDGILAIPQFIVNAWTEKMFRNMIALEHCHYPNEPCITDYVFLLSCLIKTDEDADFLIKKGIIVNHLGGSNHMTRLFYSLGESTAVVSLKSAYGDLCKQLDMFCDQPKLRWRPIFIQGDKGDRKCNYCDLKRDYRDLKRNYCKTPLQTLATIGGISLVIFTVIQAVCSILQVK